MQRGGRNDPPYGMRMRDCEGAEVRRVIQSVLRGLTVGIAPYRVRSDPPEISARRALDLPGAS